MLPNKPEIIDIVSYKDEKNGNVSIQHKNGYYRLDYYKDAIYDEKDFVKMVKNIEKLVRRSDEYSNFIGVLKNEHGLTRCAVLNNISCDDESNVEIEFHHYPFTLYDICSSVLENMLKNKEKVSTFLVAKKVIELHQDNKIGVVPLCKTVHDLVHAGEIFINLKQVFGYYYDFAEMYKEELDAVGLIDLYNQLVDLSEQNIDYSASDILQYKGIGTSDIKPNSVIQLDRTNIEKSLLDDDEEDE